MPRTEQPARCYFLELPTELRLHIYDYALHDSAAITITSAAVTEDDAASFEREDTEISFTSIEGLPPNHLPVIQNSYDASLLSISDPPTIPSPASSFLSAAPSDDASISTSSSHSFTSTTSLPIPTPLALLQTSRQIHAELSSHITFYRTHVSSLYITYPTGLLVLRTLAPHLLRSARAVHISGAYAAKPRPAPQPTPADAQHDAPSTDRRRGTAAATRSRPPLHHHPPPAAEPTVLAATAALGALVRTLFPPTPHPALQTLELRLYYPDEAAYAGVWSDEASPVAVALKNVCGGDIDMEVSRGRRGTGVVVRARPNPAGRVISTTWRRLGEGRAECEGFVVGEGWGRE